MEKYTDAIIIGSCILTIVVGSIWASVLLLHTL